MQQDNKIWGNRPSLVRVCSTQVSSRVFCPSPFRRSQTSRRRLRTGAASVHSGGCRGRPRRGKTASPPLPSPPPPPPLSPPLHRCHHRIHAWPCFFARPPLCGSGRTCEPAVWCGWCSSRPGGRSRSPPCRQNQRGTRSLAPRASSQLYLCLVRRTETEKMMREKTQEFAFKEHNI